MHWVLGMFLLAPHLTPSDVKEIQIIKDTPVSENLEAAEKRYHRITQRQIVSDLVTLYSRLDEAEIALPSFTPDGPHRPDGDLGFGFHVVRRLTFTLADGETKVIEVNEAWNQDRKGGGLYAPDEIRVKTRVFPGPRHVVGSDEQYLYDNFRVAWGPGPDDVKFYRRTRFTWDGDSNTHKKMRVPVSSPLLCVSCHSSPTTRAKRFLAPGESIDHERIVQNSQFRVPAAKSLGVKEYVRHLRAKAFPEETIAKISQAIENPRRAFHVPQLAGAWSKFLAEGTNVWLGGDLELSPSDIATFKDLPGFYYNHENPRLDVLQRFLLKFPQN